jgi:hypothetical protein
MRLIEIRHYERGNNLWYIPNIDEDWSEEECRAYVAEENKKRETLLIHNEICPTDYYMTDKALPDWEDVARYDLSKCPSKDMSGSTCAEGCGNCPYEGSSHLLQLQQQIEWIKKECAYLCSAAG